MNKKCWEIDLQGNNGKGEKVKILKLRNMYTGAFRVKEVEDDYPTKTGQVISFDEDITDKDYRLYRVIEIKEVV